MKLGSRIGYYFLWGACWLTGMLPAWFLYNVLLWVIYFFVYKVAGYRVKVVRENLENSFPDKSDDELRAIERGFYRHLAEVFIDTIDLVSISERAVRKRLIIENLEEHEKAVEGKNWIAALAHYGSWELFGVYQLSTKTQAVGIYHELHSKAFDQFYIKLRSRFGLLPVSMSGVLRYVVDSKDNKDGNFLLGLISDQIPRERKYPLWHWFLNQKTIFFNGMEAISRKYNMPVYFVHLEKVKPGHYKARFEMIYDGQETTERGEVTERYVRRLEQTICDKPEYWMWSHRRWKRKENMPSDEDMPFPRKISGS